MLNVIIKTSIWLFFVLTLVVVVDYMTTDTLFLTL
jgi:hypothetical protein